jgi:hypothetical protein
MINNNNIEEITEFAASNYPDGAVSSKSFTSTDLSIQ